MYFLMYIYESERSDYCILYCNYNSLSVVFECMYIENIYIFINLCLGEPPLPFPADPPADGSAQGISQLTLIKGIVPRD